jgi:hypothetical protein
VHKLDSEYCARQEIFRKDRTTSVRVGAAIFRALPPNSPDPAEGGLFDSDCSRAPAAAFHDSARCDFCLATHNETRFGITNNPTGQYITLSSLPDNMPNEKRGAEGKHDGNMWLRSKQSSRCCGNWPSYNAELRHHLSWEKWMCRALLIHISCRML